jgi:3-oxoacyl-[acyl-carrier-protein] synthase-3
MKRPRTKIHKPNRTVSIVGTGSYVPEKVLTNAELEKSVDTTEEWIVTRTGIRERRIAAEGEFTSHMGAKAAQRALDQAGISPAEVDLIIVATVTPDTFFPSTACHIQRLIGASAAACFDVSAACSGFLYGIEIAQQFIGNHTYNTVLVIGADKLSSIVNWEDRNTCVLFGDGAGAAVLRFRANSHGVITTYMGSDGNYGDILHMPGGGCAIPVTAENLPLKLNTLQMNGRETFKQAVISMQTAAKKALEQSGLTVDDLTCAVGKIPHQPGPLWQHFRGRRCHRPGRGKPHGPLRSGRLYPHGCFRRWPHVRQFSRSVVIRAHRRARPLLHRQRVQQPHRIGVREYRKGNNQHNPQTTANHRSTPRAHATTIFHI